MGNDASIPRDSSSAQFRNLLEIRVWNPLELKLPRGLENGWVPEPLNQHRPGFPETFDYKSPCSNPGGPKLYILSPPSSVASQNQDPSLVPVGAN